MKHHQDPRQYPERPLVGVGGIVFQGDKVLLIRRGREPGRGKWSIPGGGVRLGETLEQAVKREMGEETGLLVEPVALVEVLERIIPGKDGRIRYHYILIDYLCRVRDGILRAGSDALEADFFDLEGLEKMDMTDGTAPVVRRAKFFLDKPLLD
jgi:ADP-ribose pyrophosphatase YjhB (NUDIX family)